MKKLAVGILAHVDAGKTTLSEAMLYVSGRLKKLGRVDHRDAFLDNDAQERERGITIFSKQAILPLGQTELTLLDTPGHVDFSAEMERTLRVLDCAILVISGADGVQGHTHTLWRLLKRYGIPTFLFVNKMDLNGANRALLMDELRRLDSACVEFDGDPAAFAERVALCDEGALEEFLETGAVAHEKIEEMILRRKVFPCYFGSALKLDGVERFLKGIEEYARVPVASDKFGARVFKISRDPMGGRLTWMKVTGGELRVKALLSNRDEKGVSGDRIWEEKVDQIRLYSGEKFRTADVVPAGTVCAVTGLSRTFAGEGLGAEAESDAPMLQPVLTYRIDLPQGCEPHTALAKLRILEEEDPTLHVEWNERLREMHIQLMGEVQMEVLTRLITDRFGMQVSFGEGSIVYRETIAAPVEGMGHFEPLRHYAEVHLLLEPGERGSGMRFATMCSEDVLDRNWQRLILTHLYERSYPGVLTASPITDIKITLVTGRAHLKHTEGGDFRQATYRAVRHGLMRAENILLEPWYDFRIEIPEQNLGRAIADVQRMHGSAEAPEYANGFVILRGSAPVATMRGYAVEVASYSRGLGRLICTLRGYEPCHNAEEVVLSIGYDPERDVENPADSVFCDHGAGFVVKWDQVQDYMHLESGLKLGQAEKKPEPDARRTLSMTSAGDEELRAIFERTYGPVKRRDFREQRPVVRSVPEVTARSVELKEELPEYLLVDGYNIIYAWEDLNAVAQENLEAARQRLMDMLCNYQGARGCQVILVFDAYRVPRGMRNVSKYHNIHVVYTKEAETADAYIERTSYEMRKKYRVRVATSDGAEQLIILGHGAERISARVFREEMEAVKRSIAKTIGENAAANRLHAMETAMKKAQDEQKGQK